MRLTIYERVKQAMVWAGPVQTGMEVENLPGQRPALRQVREDLSDWIRLDPSVQFFLPRMDTDEHGWGKDFDANCANFREGVRGWMGVLAVWPPDATRGQSWRQG